MTADLMRTQAQTSDSVLAFWFGPSAPLAERASRQFPLWFKGGPDVDAEIRERFGEVHARAVSGALDDWAERPEGRVALIIVLDQFSRNLYRGTPEAFAHDGQALALSLEALAGAEDRQLDLLERVFLYMPLEHAESLAMQERCVACFEALLDDVPAGAQKTFQGFLDYAREHRDIVKRFGRFPHRNAILGRTSTDAEVQYLNQGGQTFGQQVEP